MIGLKRWSHPLRDIGFIAALLTGLSFLPPDTSLQDRRAAGFIRYCVADLQSPLIQAEDGKAPGPELKLMQRVAADLGLQLRLIETANMGRSFNPSDWNISRGQCDILGGGLADTPNNRGFGTVLPLGLSLELRLIGSTLLPEKGGQIGIYMGHAGFDRLRLSAWLRKAGYRAKPLRDAKDLRAWLGQGGLAIASNLAPLPAGLPETSLPAEATEPLDLAVILWRGDTTFTRAFREALKLAHN